MGGLREEGVYWIPAADGRAKMDCCVSQAIDKEFDEKSARRDLRRYQRGGLGQPARKIVEALKARGVANAEVLEVGGGVGGLHIELLKAGASRATDVDLSGAYVKAARQLAEQAGFARVVEHVKADFAAEGEGVPEADIVVLNRVVCCYPDMPALVRAAARHARRRVALSYPRDAGLIRLGVRLANGFLRLMRNPFRVYAHPDSAIKAVAKAEGLRPVLETFSGVWKITILDRAAPLGGEG